MSRRCASAGSRNISPHAMTASNVRSKNVESSTASQATGIPGKLRRNASMKDGDASIALGHTLRARGKLHTNRRAVESLGILVSVESITTRKGWRVPTVIVRQPFIPKFRPIIRCRAQAEFHRVKFVVTED